MTVAADRPARGFLRRRQPFAVSDLAQSGWSVLEEESFAAKQVLDAQSHQHSRGVAGKPEERRSSQFSLGILNTYSAMSDEADRIQLDTEFPRQCGASYKSTNPFYRY